jgi:hypothetical protein
MSWLSPSLAGFQVATYGRFWVATEEPFVGSLHYSGADVGEYVGVPQRILPPMPFDKREAILATVPPTFHPLGVFMRRLSPFAGSPYIRISIPAMVSQSKRSPTPVTSTLSRPSHELYDDVYTHRAHRQQAASNGCQYKRSHVLPPFEI